MTEGGGPSLDQVFHALADPTRRGIVATLVRGPASVSGIVATLVRGPASVSGLAGPLDMTLSAVLQHLRVLIDSGLVTSTKVGRVRTCAIDTGALRRAEEWLGGQRTTWERRLDRLESGIAGTPVQVRNHDDAGMSVTDGPFMSATLPLAGLAIIEAATIEEAVRLASQTPCAVAQGVVEVWLPRE